MKFTKTKKFTAVLAALIVMASVSTTAFAAQPVSADTPPTAVLASSAYSIVSGATSGGKISPEGSITANHGESKTISIVPNTGYVINEVIVDGTRKGAISSYTFSNITSSHSILASFRPASQAAYTTNLLKTDTRSYQMSPNNIYDARITVEGQKFNQGNVKVYSSRDGIASVQRITNDTYRIRGLNPGTTYIIAEAGNTHASIRVDVVNGVKQHGESCRSVSIIGLDSTPIDYTTPTVPTTPSGGITAERAKQIATQHANASNPYFVKCQLEYENGRQVYDVEFYSGNREFDYEIDAATGTIVKYDTDIENFTIPGSGTGTGTAITADRAKQIATQHANVSNPYFVKCQLDYENGRRVYEVEFYSGNREFDYEIDAATGTILKYDTDIENFTIPGTNPGTGNTAAVTADRAKQIALSHAGVSASQVFAMKVEQDYDHGMLTYEIEFKSGRMEYEYKINAANGQILKAERDYD